MTLLQELARVSTIFLDTAPVIYYIEAHPRFGPLAREVVTAFQSERVKAFSSVMTLAEVVAKPVELGDEKLARKFAEFLKAGRNLTLVEISASIAERAGRLRGRYPPLRTIDAVQIAAALYVGADAFITNDVKLRRIREVRILILKDHL